MLCTVRVASKWTWKGTSERVRAPFATLQAGAIAIFRESGCLGMQPKSGGKLHLKLNTGTRPIANKYREGKVKSTLKRESKRPRNRWEGNECGHEDSTQVHGASEWVSSSVRTPRVWPWRIRRGIRNPVWSPPTAVARDPAESEGRCLRLRTCLGKENLQPSARRSGAAEERCDHFRTAQCRLHWGRVAREPACFAASHCVQCLLTLKSR